MQLAWVRLCEALNKHRSSLHQKEARTQCPKSSRECARAGEWELRSCHGDNRKLWALRSLQMRRVKIRQMQVTTSKPVPGGILPSISFLWPPTRSAYMPRPLFKYAERRTHRPMHCACACACVSACSSASACGCVRVCASILCSAWLRFPCQSSLTAAAATAAGPRQAAKQQPNNRTSRARPGSWHHPWTWAIARHIREKVVHMVKSSSCSSSSSSTAALERQLRDEGAQPTNESP